MKRQLFLLFIVIAATAHGQTIPADIATGRRMISPTPRFREVHEAFTRIVLNESGWNSRADIGGILEVHLSNSGGRSTSRERTYGIDLRRFIYFSARVARRTFPAISPYIFPESRETHETWQKQYGNPYWTSTLKLNCSEPDHWSEVYPKNKWRDYKDRCKALVKLTEEYLKGEHPAWCRIKTGEPAQPQFWGSDADFRRFPEVRTWEELTCDEPNIDCTKDRRNSSCAKNRWFRLPRKS